MTLNTIVKFQIGKAGITPALIQQLNHLFEHHKHIRISVLASSGRDRASIQTMTDQLKKQVAHVGMAKIIGFTIVLRRQTNPPKARPLPRKPMTLKNRHLAATLFSKREK